MAERNSNAEARRDFGDAGRARRQRDRLAGRHPAAVGFTDASWNATVPAEVDASDASLGTLKSASVCRTEDDAPMTSAM